MRPAVRKISAMLVLAAGLALAGCEDQKLLELFDNKAKLSGTRVPVFPEGVPGVQQGVPPELMKGYQAQAEQQAQAQAAAAEAERAAAEERKTGCRPKSQSQSASPSRGAQQAAPQQSQPSRRAARPAAAPPATTPTSAPLQDRWPTAQQETPAGATSAATIGDDEAVAGQCIAGRPSPTDRFTR